MSGRGVLVWRDMTNELWYSDDAENGWLLCEHPERPPDDHTHVHLVKCRACRIGAEMAARLWPERWKLVYELQTLYWEQP